MTEQLVRALTGDPRPLLDPLAARLQRLSAQQRYEEAAELRDRAAALSRALERQRRFDAIRRAGQLAVATPEGAWAVIDGGLMRNAGTGTATTSAEDLPLRAAAPPPEAPLPRDLVDEVATITSWLEARADRVRLLSAEHALWWPADRLPTFAPRAPAGGARS